MYRARAEALRVPEIERLDTMSSNALENFQQVFPYGGVLSKNGTFRSWFCMPGEAALYPL
jgi:hypothetical protein